MLARSAMDGGTLRRRSVVLDVLASWRTPRRVVRELLERGVREDRVFGYLMAACLIIFVAQWPRLARETYLAGTALDQRIAYELVAWLIVWPLVFYGIAALSHLAARAAGGSGSLFGARLALFWALLASVPGGMLSGLVAGFIGPGVQLAISGMIWLGGFGVIWICGLLEVQRKGGAA